MELLVGFDSEFLKKVTENVPNRKDSERCLKIFLDFFNFENNFSEFGLGDIFNWNF